MIPSALHALQTHLMTQLALKQPREAGVTISTFSVRTLSPEWTRNMGEMARLLRPDLGCRPGGEHQSLRLAHHVLQPQRAPGQARLPRPSRRDLPGSPRRLPGAPVSCPPAQEGCWLRCEGGSNQETCPVHQFLRTGLLFHYKTFLSDLPPS